MPVRPGSLSLCGIVLILFGTMTLMNLFKTELMPANMQTMVGPVDNPLDQALQKLPGFVELKKAMLAPKLLLGIVGLFAGIGVIKGRESSRKLALAWSLGYLVLGMAEPLANVGFSRAAIAAMEMPKAVPADQIAVLRERLFTSTLIGTGFAVVFVVVLALLLFIQLSKRECVEFCTFKPFSRQRAETRCVGRKQRQRW